MGLSTLPIGSKGGLGAPFFKSHGRRYRDVVSGACHAYGTKFWGTNRPGCRDTSETGSSSRTLPLELAAGDGGKMLRSSSTLQRLRGQLRHLSPDWLAPSRL